MKKKLKEGPFLYLIIALVQFINFSFDSTFSGRYICVHIPVRRIQFRLWLRSRYKARNIFRTLWRNRELRNAFLNRNPTIGFSMCIICLSIFSRKLPFLMPRLWAPEGFFVRKKNSFQFFSRKRK